MIRKYRKAIAFGLVLSLFTVYVALDTFVISRVYGEAVGEQDAAVTEENNGTGSDQTEENQDAAGENNNDGSDSDASSGRHKGHHGPRGEGKSPGRHSDSSDSGDGDTGSSISQSSVTEGSSSTIDSYSDGDVKVTLKEYRENDTSIYVADVQVSSAKYLKTALAQDSYGKNVTEKTSEIAENNNAILAVNGDYYGTQENGYVIRNGKLYRDTAVSGREDLVIYSDGSFEIIREEEITAKQLMAKGAVQTLSFGPALIEDSAVSVDTEDEVGKAKASNPRTAIGMIDDGHYVFVVSDGRSSASTGLSLLQLAEFMKSLGVKTAYNLDGGGSSTMYFNGSVVNNPTTGGSTTKERSVSDIVYIG
ncbi:MAG: phosphodiester glycosidase family protein [Clostridiales bacterium]|nr:phosphodiester glycosidase family protein [Clostridiales bacterium]